MRLIFVLFLALVPEISFAQKAQLDEKDATHVTTPQSTESLNTEFETLLDKICNSASSNKDKTPSGFASGTAFLKLIEPFCKAADSIKVLLVLNDPGIGHPSPRWPCVNKLLDTQSVIEISLATILVYEHKGRPKWIPAIEAVRSVITHPDPNQAIENALTYCLDPTKRLKDIYALAEWIKTVEADVDGYIKWEANDVRQVDSLFLIR